MAIIIEKIKSDLWGDCVRVSNGEIEFVVTIEIGPRIIRLGKVGGPNELFEDPVKEAFVEHEELEKFWGNNRFYNMGGHRLWHSPENMPKTYLDNYNPIKYEILSNGIKVVSDYEKLGLSNIIEATMEENGEMTIDHYVKNIGDAEQEFAPWAITIFALGGLGVTPVSKIDTGFLSNRTLMMWPYADANDKRFKMDNKYIYVTTDSTGDIKNVNAFKIGTNNVDGYAMYFNHNNLFVKTFDYDSEAKYPDNGCNSETYTNFRLMEIESLGAIQNVKPGEMVKHTEKWYLHLGVEMPNNPEQIDEIVAKYVK